MVGNQQPRNAAPSIPSHAVEAAAAYEAEFDELLAHLAKHPTERWVAYRGRQRLQFGTDDGELHRTCHARFPDGQFCVFGIDPALKQATDTVV